MKIIAEALNCNLKSNQRKRDTYVEKNYEIIVKTIVSRSNLIEYLNKYPLMSSKRMNYLDWIKAHKIVIDKSYKSDEGTQDLINLKSGMNVRRTQFKWSDWLK
uniref:LAGLIDADG endonuclease n=1 Tax=Cutaneotrichosporon cutaneum TaxID=5554 RepID=UPI00226CC3CA|nr:LAGLIDADG endonuclease [Cutaneotrichosporon cutaneum]UZC57715.1 LAGLIDADG endonuclease [Cutaneotrichosporon cutaneum]